MTVRSAIANLRSRRGCPSIVERPDLYTAHPNQLAIGDNAQQITLFGEGFIPRTEVRARIVESYQEACWLDRLEFSKVHIVVELPASICRQSGPVIIWAINPGRLHSEPVTVAVCGR